MMSYLTAETGFIRAFGNRSLLLIFLCALSRSSTSFGKASALGISLDLNPAAIVVFGPFLALMLLVALKVEADSLVVARAAVLDEAAALPRLPRKRAFWIYGLFCVPALASTFLFLQFLLKLVPADAGCGGWNWLDQLTNFRWVGGTASKYCVGDIIVGTPWIYPPWQTYAYLASTSLCVYLTYGIARSWPQYRGSADGALRRPLRG